MDYHLQPTTLQTLVCQKNSPGDFCTLNKSGKSFGCLQGASILYKDLTNYRLLSYLLRPAHSVWKSQKKISFNILDERANPLFTLLEINHSVWFKIFGVDALKKLKNSNATFWVIVKQCAFLTATYDYPIYSWRMTRSLLFLANWVILWSLH